MSLARLVLPCRTISLIWRSPPLFIWKTELRLCLGIFKITIAIGGEANNSPPHHGKKSKLSEPRIHEAYGKWAHFYGTMLSPLELHYSRRGQWQQRGSGSVQVVTQFFTQASDDVVVDGTIAAKSVKNAWKPLPGKRWARDWKIWGWRGDSNYVIAAVSYWFMLAIVPRLRFGLDFLSLMFLDCMT